MATNAMDKYIEGSIVRIKLENFMTYSYVEFNPGPNLNLIAAPNGCGKSTLVNGICLGLAGKTKYLGRAAQPAEFIKHGCEYACTEIELKNESGENYVIKREIHRNGNNSWAVNGRTANQKSVEEAVTRMNIQVGNLCQFLPQDKVADFAKMNSIELLENTEKAVGSQELIDSHEMLKSSRGKARDIEAKFRSLGEKIETEKAKNARLEQDVKNYKERQRHLEHVELLGKKRAWLTYEEKRRIFMAEKERKKAVQQRLANTKRENAPLELKLKASQAVIKVNEQRMQKVTDTLRRDAEQAANRNKNIDNLSDKMAEVRDELESKREDEVKRQKKVVELRNQVRSLQHELAALEDTEDVQPEIDQVNREKHKLMQQKATLSQEIENIRMDMSKYQNEHNAATRELQSINDSANQKLDLLRQKHKPTFEAVRWLRENKQKFQGIIHEPIMTQIKIKNEKFAKYVECSISFNDMRLFVCEQSEDVHLFLRLVRDEQNLSINAACEPLGASSIDQFQPNEPIRNLAKFGFHTYVKDLFEAPESIMIYLCKQYNLHNIPVGDRRTKDSVDMISRERPRIQKFFSENDSHVINRSRYTGNISTTRAELRPMNLLSGGVDVTVVADLTRTIRDLEQQLTAKRTRTQALNAELHQYDIKINDCNNSKKELVKRRDQHSSFTQQIATKQISIVRLEKDSSDIAVEECKAMKRIQEINLDKCKLLEDMKTLTKRCAEHSMAKVKYNLCYTVALRARSDVETQFQEQLSSIQRLEQELLDVTAIADRAKEEARRLFAKAQEATGTGNGGELAPEFRDSFSRLPETLEEIDAQIHATQARADCTFETGDNVMHEFEEREKEIAKMVKEYDITRRRLDNYESEIEENKKAWFEPLNDLISRINKNFSYFFKALKCAGEVELKTPENAEDYEKYGIQIKVKFRDSETLRVLSAHAQSGGEKSVSTVLYMMALQELTKCPFRVVDEINQGMDAYNERKVYEMVLNTACERSTSQYFLLTPKLLPDLQYSENMTVLTIFNGPSMVGQKDWNVRKFLKRRSRLESE